VARKKKRSRFRFFLLSLFFIFVLWAATFLVWLFWKEIQSLSVLSGKKTAEPARKPSQEKISEEERKKLDEILKRRQ
jgi:hypothetical protein